MDLREKFLSAQFFKSSGPQSASSFALFVVLSAVQSSCLQPRRDPEIRDRIKQNLSKISTPLRAGDGANFAVAAPEDLDKSNAFFESEWGWTMDRRVGALPTSARLDWVPYSGDAYRNSQGGTNRTKALTRYDQAFGTKAAAWESSSEGHGPEKNSDIEWAGHCNGLAAASSRLAEPTESIERNGVTFSASDIKALLAEIHMSARAVVLAGKACDAAQPNIPDPAQRTNPEQMNECEDVNPGAFHLALTNIVGGELNIPLLIDNEINRPKWNFPVYSYECRNCTAGKFTEIPADQATRIVSRVANPNGSYKFDPGAKKFFDVQMDLTFADVNDDEKIGVTKAGKKSLRYILEVNAAGEIIGGEWALANQNNHPDFAWLAFEPVRGTGEKQFANPQIDPDIVMALWADSRRKSGDLDPQPRILSPRADRDMWGVYPDLRMTLGTSKGSLVIANIDTQLQLQLTNAKFNNTQAIVELNGQRVDALSINVASPARIKLKPRLGPNKLSVYGDGAQALSRYELRFVAYP